MSSFGCCLGLRGCSRSGRASKPLEWLCSCWLHLEGNGGSMVAKCLEQGYLCWVTNSKHLDLLGGCWCRQVPGVVAGVRLKDSLELTSPDLTALRYYHDCHRFEPNEHHFHDPIWFFVTLALKWDQYLDSYLHLLFLLQIKIIIDSPNHQSNQSIQRFWSDLLWPTMRALSCWMTTMKPMSLLVEQH